MLLESALQKLPEGRIYRLFGVCVSLAIASLIVPRFVSNPEGGFASGASAILALLMLLGVTLLFSLYLLSVTVQQYNNLPVMARVAGIGPSLVLAVTLLALFSFLSY